MTLQARSIEQPVGKQGLNRGSDVKVIQILLNGALERHSKFKAAGTNKLTADGDCGPLTISAIEAFQRTVLGWSGAGLDGTVHPNRTTWKALNGNVASNEQINAQCLPRPPIDGFAAFKQGDYSATALGNGSLNIGGHGCALCTLTMAATVIGSPTRHWPADLLPSDLTPPIANDIIRKAGAFSGSLLTMGSAAEALGMTYDEYGMRPGNWNDTLDADDVLDIESNLVAGNPVAANVDYKSTARGDHWILITRRYGNGTFGCIDPASGAGLTLTKSRPPAAAAQQGMDRELEGGVLFGWKQGGSASQQKYVVKRFALLAPGSGGFCASL